jgi:hypothetical protein
MRLTLASSSPSVESDFVKLGSIQLRGCRSSVSPLTTHLDLCAPVLMAQDSWGLNSFEAAEWVVSPNWGERTFTPLSAGPGKVSN